MLAIRAIFDGKAFVPQQPVTLPDQSEVLVIIDQADPAKDKLDAELRAYYESDTHEDDDAWGKATTPQSQRAWTEE